MNTENDQNNPPARLDKKDQEEPEKEDNRHLDPDAAFCWWCGRWDAYEYTDIGDRPHIRCPRCGIIL